MAIELTFLGSGHAFSDYRINYHTNAILHLDDNKYFMIDCGGTAVQSLKELSIHPEQIVGVFITHCHGDHCGGLEQLIWERLYTSKAGGPGWLPTSVWVGGFEMQRLLLDYLRPVLDPWTNEKGEVTRLPYFSDGRELVPMHVVSKSAPYLTHNMMDLYLKAEPVIHVHNAIYTKSAYALRVRGVPRDPAERSVVIAYSGDKIFSKDFFEKPADYYFHECSFLPRYPGTVHTHYEEILTVPGILHSKIALMHHALTEEEIKAKETFIRIVQKHSTFYFE